jgi:hypothetical protein
MFSRKVTIIALLVLALGSMFRARRPTLGQYGPDARYTLNPGDFVLVFSQKPGAAD